MSDRVRVGLVGTSGYPEFVYLPVLTQHENAEVVARRNDYMPTPNFYDSFRVQQVMDAAIRSHDSGCWVDVE